MKKESNSLFKLIGSKLTYLGVIICFVLISTYFIVVGEQSETNLSSTQQSLAMDQIETKLTSATLLHTDLEKSTIEQQDISPELEKSTFALLQNNPTLGKTLTEESQDELTLNDAPEEVVGNESVIDPSEQLESESAIDNTSPNQLENESAQEDNTVPVENELTQEDNPITPVENDPALDKPIIVQQPSFPYSEKLPIPYEHQEYLYSLCMYYGLDYEKVLAVMEHESKFDPNAIGATSDFGYFQINSINHAWLSETLGTPNDPLDPYVNMQWGTFFLSDLIGYWEKEGLTGTALEEAVLSSYNKGKTGYRRTGKAVNYVEKVRESHALILNKYM